VLVVIEYIKAKMADYAILLDWIQRELQNVADRHPEHLPVIVRLQSELTDAKGSHGYLKEQMEMSNGKVLSVIRDIEYFVVLAASYYLPPLQKEREADQFVRRLLLSVTKQCGLDWIEDIVVHLDGQHATFANLVVETPLILAPPQHAISLLDMPGLYHELGHNVFDRLPKIAKVLRVAVSEHSALLHTKAGSLTPEQGNKWNSAANNVLEYWRIGRLSELFCDIFATFVCGPAHYISCIDMGLRSDCDPFIVDNGDIHPPFSTRIYICYKSLNIIYANEPMIAMARDAWENYEGAEGACKRDESFELVCSESLLDCLIDASIRCIGELLPNAKYYSTPLPRDEELEYITEEMSLEEMLNRGAKILFTCPERYASWEEEIFKQLKAIYKPDLSM
jgi:hypothetical protein